MADLHLGGWREDTLREVGIKAFEKAIDISIDENVDFILISGDFLIFLILQSMLWQEPQKNYTSLN